MNWIPSIDAAKVKPALQVAIATTLATIITLAFHMPHPFWAPAIVIMLMDDYNEGSFKKGMTRLTSTIAGAVFAYFLGHFTLGNELFYYVAMFIVVTVCIYGFLLGISAFLNFGVTFLFLTMYMVLDPSGSLIIAIWRSSEILTGVACWVFVSILFFPTNLKLDIDKTVEALITDSQNLMQQMQNALDKDETLSWDKDKSPLKNAFNQLKTYQSLLPSYGRQQDLFTNLSVLSEKGWTWWRSSGQLYEMINQNKDLKDILMPLLQQMTQLLNEWHKSIENNTYMTYSLDTLMEEIDKAMLPLVENAMQTKQQAHVLLLQTWLTNSEDWLSCIKTYLEKTELAAPAKISQTLGNQFHTFYVKLVSKISLLPHCFATGIGCCLVTYVWLLTGWPGGVCAGISALVVGADSSLTKINLKIRLRLMGSIVGSTIGLLAFIFLINNVISLLVIVFVGVAIFAYISQNGFKNMYFCWMATMGFVITAVPDVYHTTSIGFTFERAFGLIMGLVVMAFVVNFFWPLNAKQQFAELCQNIKKKLAISWSYLSKTSTQNLTEQRRYFALLQMQLMDLVAQGNAIAKPSGLGKQMQPVIQTVITLPWCKNYITETALDYLNTTFPKQWQQLCMDTHDAIMANDKKQISSLGDQWSSLSSQLALDNADESCKQAIAQCWLMLEANKRFCDQLASLGY